MNEEKNQNNDSGKLEARNDMSLNYKDMTISEIAECLKEGKLHNDDTIDESVILQCVEYFKEQCYTDEMIAVILDRNPRTIRRYKEKLRQKNSLILGENFQKEFLGDMVANWKRQLSYFIYLANKDDVHPLDKMKAIFYTHQIQKDMVDALGKYGYLSKDRGLKDFLSEELRIGENLKDVYFASDPNLEGVPSEELVILNLKILKFIEDESKSLIEKYKPEAPETNKE